MNLYKLHNDPNQLYKYDQMTKIPEFALIELQGNISDKEREQLKRIVMKDPEQAYWYSAINLHYTRWPEAEQYIKKDPKWAREYAVDIIKDRWPEAEPYIMKSPNNAYLYAKEFRDELGRRWPPAEKAIATKPGLSGAYAIEVLGHRWPEMEEAILSHKYWGQLYSERFLE